MDRLSGLIEAKNILNNIKGMKMVYFSEIDVVRHKLVQEIIKAYEAHENTGKKKNTDSRENSG